MTNIMKSNSRRLFYINLDDWVWWAWTLTTVLLVAGLSGYAPALIGATAVTAAHGVIVLVRDRSLVAYSVQLRAAYLLLLLICQLHALAVLADRCGNAGAYRFRLLLFDPRSLPVSVEQSRNIYAGSIAPDFLFRPQS
jgi:hypothetical protein